MGSYMSAPVRDKESEDGTGRDGLAFGASCMQGWRVSQEDAHVVQPTFDKDAMLYVVFDGHGGSEVAKYAAQHLGDHLKSLQKYKDGRYEEALEEAFLTFDAMLKEPHVLEVLRALAKSEDSDNEANASEGSEDGEDLEGLMDDADAPLSDIVERLGPKGIQDLLSKRIDMKALLAKAVEQAEADSDSEDDEDGEEEDSDDQEESSEDEGVSVETKKPLKTRTLPARKEKLEDASEAKVKLDHLEKDDVPDSDSGGAQKVSNGMSADSSISKNDDPKQDNIDSTTTTTTVTVTTTTVTEEKSAKRNTRSRIIDDDAAGSSAGSSSVPDSSTEGPAGGSSSSSSGNDDSIAAEADDKDGDYRPQDEIDSDDDDEEEIDENECGPDPRIFLSNFGEMNTAAGYDSGATACVAFIKNGFLYVANVGDSRCVVSENGIAVEMSQDHKPEDPVETARIEKAGGRVTSDGRVNNGLNLSRALGDHSYKKNEELDLADQMISAKPDVRKIALTRDHEFMVIACDGIWNSMSSQAVIDFVRPRLAQNEGRLSRICEELFDAVLAPHAGGDGTGMDNMTCVIVKLPQLDGPVTNGNHEVDAVQSTPIPEPQEPVTQNGGLKRPAPFDDNAFIEQKKNELLKKMKIDDHSLENGVVENASAL